MTAATLTGAPKTRSSRSTFSRYWADHRTAVIGMFLLSFLILLAIFGPVIAPHDPNAMGADLLQSPSSAHWMGTDQFGRDYFSRWLYAGRTSLEIAGLSVALGVVVGGLIGLIAGYKNKSALDTVTMRGVDALLTIPDLVLLLALVGLLGEGFNIGPVHVTTTGALIVFMAIIFSPYIIRIARASVLEELQEDYVSAARALGLKTSRILFRNLFPNMVPSLVIQASFLLAIAVGLEATVSFLGFGIQPPESSWGTLLNGSNDYILSGNWWLIVFPVAIIVVAVFAFNLLGEGLRDVLDPKRRSKGDIGT